MTTQTADIELAIAKLNATYDEPTDTYIYSEDAIGQRRYRVEADDLADLGRRLREEQADAYSLWCAETDAEPVVEQIDASALTLTLGDVEGGEPSTEDEPARGGWRNGEVTLPDGRTFAAGGGWVRTAADCDRHVSENRGDRPSVGSLQAYTYSEAGDVDQLATAVGWDVEETIDWLARESRRLHRAE